MHAALRRLLPVRVRRALRSARLSTWSLADRLRGGSVTPGYQGLIGEGDFDQVGAEYLGHFRELGGLEPSDDVLDIGCGVGRMASPLTMYLSDGTYHGFDVMEPAIRSCRRRLSSFPNFHFEHVDVFNGKYNPKGRIAPGEFRFPYGDATFDFAFAISVFTHMLQPDVERYLQEAARVLRPGGSVLATWFLMTPGTATLVEEGKSDVRFDVPRDGVWQADAREAEAAVAYRPEDVSDLYRRANLEIVKPIRYGRWSGAADGLSYQDVVVARRLER
jgi:SAM-dependent methyltransferase